MANVVIITLRAMAMRTFTVDRWPLAVFLPLPSANGQRPAANDLESGSLMNAAIVIPARWASTRFPGKPLAMIAGVSLIQRVYERAVRARRAAAVYVATDDARIAKHVESFGGRVLQPEGDFQSGTDRIAAALRLLDD